MPGEGRGSPHNPLESVGARRWLARRWQRGLNSRFRCEARGEQISVFQCLCGRTCDTGFFNLGKI